MANQTPHYPYAQQDHRPSAGSGKGAVLLVAVGWLFVSASVGQSVHAQTGPLSNSATSKSSASASTPATLPANANLNAARAILKQSKQALESGDLGRARQLALQAKSMNVTYQYWDETPDALLNQIEARASAQADPSKSKSGSTKPGTAGVPGVPPADPRALVKQGREALNAGKLDQAQSLALQASALGGSRWGLFEDSPSRLMADINSARTRQNKAAAASLLVEARQHLQNGNLDKAEECALKAERLHGPYSMWDLGDRPQKVLAAVQSMREANRVTRVPTPPGVNPGKSANPNGVQQTGYNQTTASNLSTANPNATAKDSPARRLMAEAKALQSKGQLVEARNKLLEAQKLRERFAPSEVSPEQALALVMADGQKQIGQLMNEATAKTKSDPAAAQRAVQSARSLAVGLGLDTHLIDQRAALLQKTNTTATASTPAASTNVATVPTTSSAQVGKVATTPTATPTTAAATATGTGTPSATQPQQPKTVAQAPVNQGVEMLNHARLELRRGETETARRLAVQVFNGPYNLRTEAESLLRSIEAEETAQRRNNANRAFDTALLAHKSGDYTKALSICREIDKTLLTAQRQQQMDEVLREAQAKLAPPTPAAPQPNATVQAPASPMMPVPTLPMPLTTTASAKNTPATPSGTLVARSPAAMPSPAAPLKLVQESQPNLPTPPVPASPMMPPLRMVDQGPITLPPQPTLDRVTPPQMASTMPSQPGSPKKTQPTSGLAQEVLAMQEIEFQKLRSEGLKLSALANERFTKGQTDEAIAMLEEYLERLADAGIDSQKATLLKRSTEQRLQRFRMLKAQRDFETAQVRQRTEVLERRDRARKAAEHQQAQVTELMRQFNTALSEGKYPEAEMLAMKAHELDPDDPATSAAVHIARIRKNQAEYRAIKDQREEFFRVGLNDAEKEGPPLTTDNPIHFDRERTLKSASRDPFQRGLSLRTKTDAERQIERKLQLPVVVDFQSKPLGEVINELRALSGLNMVVDSPALEEKGISLSKPITVPLTGVSLKSALNIILQQANLTYVIKDEALQITTEKHARGKQMRKTYGVADLVIPIDNFYTPDTLNLQRQLGKPAYMSGSLVVNGQVGGIGPPMPFVGPNGLPNGAPVPTGSGTIQNQTTGPGGMLQASPMQDSANVSTKQHTIEQALIKLITSTIEPHTWAEMGGSGIIEYFPHGHALVITQTPDVQEQVAELLETLRRLQDLEVAVEVRLISLSETFFERIGLDFALNIKTDNSTKAFEQALSTGVFKPIGQLNDLNTKGVVVGLTPAGTFTRDLDIPIRSTSFGYAIPPFGGYPASPGFDGGLSLGLAFLNEIQVYMFMEAAQGDRRTNVMQAPKLTLFNGQTSTITVGAQQFFVTNVSVVAANGQLVFVPNNQPFPLNINLPIQAVVSADRRFVRLNISPTLTNLSSALVPLFPITTFITPTFEGGIQGQPIPFTQFVQQPTFETVTIQTTVSVPDGGTVLLGGLKTLSEGRNEFGPPILSKVPYINRLFKNVGYGREAQSLMLMVTPRIIINSEEEERQTGVVTNPQQ